MGIGEKKGGIAPGVGLVEAEERSAKGRGEGGGG